MARVIAAVSDLMFSSKITATGRAVGVDVRIAATPEALDKALADGDARLVLVDMALGAERADAMIRAAAASGSSPRIIAFYSHVETALRDAALAAGASEAMPRSRFVEQLEQIIRDAS